MPVRYLPNEMIPKTGLATHDQYGPVIFVRAAQLTTFARPLQDFLYAHECGHHALGQVMAAAMYGMFIGPDAELAADCFAMAELRRQNLVRDDSIDSILSFLAQIPGDAANYPGPARAQRFRQCMGQ